MPYGLESINTEMTTVKPSEFKSALNASKSTVFKQQNYVKDTNTTRLLKSVINIPHNAEFMLDLKINNESYSYKQTFNKHHRMFNIFDHFNIPMLGTETQILILGVMFWFKIYVFDKL